MATDSQDDRAQDIPTLKSVLQDSVHGSAWISLRALDVLRHRALELAAASASTDETRSEIDDLARKLSVARPPMVSVGNRVRRFMEKAAEIEAGARKHSSSSIRFSLHGIKFSPQCELREALA